tara:strand:- start:162 stop:1433 length:1272 start_codon:yes stop_codon:yes gene_type:complete
MKLRVLIFIFFISCSDIFDRKFLINIRIIPEEGGEVSLLNGYYEKNQEISVVATPNENYTFKGWGSIIDSYDNPLEFRLDSDKDLIANFELIDNDNDGVADALDTCPNTNLNSNVDESGCCIDTNEVTFRNLNNIPYPSAYNSSSNDGSSIYLSKGVRINSDNIIERAPEVLKYDIINDSWSVFIDKVNAVSYGASEIIGYDLYLFNGKNYPIINDRVLNDTIEKINLLTKNIIKLPNPYPAVQSGSVVWDKNIIFFGGRNLNGCLDRIVKYNISNNKFEIITNMPFPICNAKGEVYDNKLYIIGGDLDYDESDKILIYDLQEKIWLESFVMPMKLSNHTTSIYKNKILIKGDYNVLNLFAIFDIEKNKFSIIKSNVSESRFLTSQVANGEFYVLGGNATSNYSTMIDDFMVVNLETDGYFCF